LHDTALLTARIIKNERIDAMSKRKKLVKGEWLKHEVELLKKKFPHISTKEVAEKLSRAVKSVQAKASKLNLKKTKKYLKSLGRK
jgi:hypothetical protein